MLKCLSNAGASGSIFYLTADDEFIIKTVQHKEAEFLQKLLPGYYMVSIITTWLLYGMYDYIVFLQWNLEVEYLFYSQRYYFYSD